MSEATPGGHPTAQPSRPLRRARSLLGTLWAIIGISLALLLGIDGLLRLALPREARQPALASDRKRADAFEESDFVRPLFREYHASKQMVWSPYLYWRRALFDGEYVAVDSSGRRETWSAPGSRGALRVFVFGGSTIWGTGARDDHTIPSLLAKQLHAAGVDAAVSNFGESGYVSTQCLISLLLELQRGNVPDVVVFYDGANDLASAIQAGRAGIPQNEDNRRSEFNLSKSRSKLAALMLRKTFVGIDRLASRLRGPKEAPASESEIRSLADDAVHSYARNLQVLEALAAGFGFEARYYWQPSVFAKATRTPYEDSLVSARPASERALFEHAAGLISSSPELARVAGFRDLTGVFRDTTEPVFFDFIHVSEAGNALVANAMSADLHALLADGLLRNP